MEKREYERCNVFARSKDERERVINGDERSSSLPNYYDPLKFHGDHRMKIIKQY